MDRHYLKGNAATNLGRAVVQGFGNTLFSTNDNGVQFVNVPANGCIEDASLTISQSDTDILDYENLELYLYTLCEETGTPISSSVFLDALFDQATGLDDIDKQSANMEVIPNPNRGQFKVQFENKLEAGVIAISDLTGKIIHERSIQHGQNFMTSSEEQLAKGVHIITAHNGSDWITRKLLIE